MAQCLFIASMRKGCVLIMFATWILCPWFRSCNCCIILFSGSQLGLTLNRCGLHYLTWLGILISDCIWCCFVLSSACAGFRLRFGAYLFSSCLLSWDWVWARCGICLCKCWHDRCFDCVSALLCCVSVARAVFASCFTVRYFSDGFVFVDFLRIETITCTESRHCTTWVRTIEQKWRNARPVGATWIAFAEWSCIPEDPFHTQSYMNAVPTRCDVASAA